MKLLLDTSILIYLANHEPVAEAAINAIEAAAASGNVVISPVSAWELGMLVSRRRLSLSAEPLTVYHEFGARTGFQACELSPEILVAANFLPDYPQKDPMDRLMVATARRHDLTLVTDDRAIIAYSAVGHVKTLAC